MAAEGDPLFDTLFRSTAADESAVASASSVAAAAAASGGLKVAPLDADRDVRRADARADLAGSAPPQVSRGAHTRAGNAMDRTRSALLDGARLGVTRHGTKVSMAAIAAHAGVAKATLYNHFRTRDAVLSALLADEVGRLEVVARTRFAPDRSGLARALGDVAQSLAGNPVRAALAHSEPATLARIARLPGDVQPLWEQVRQGVSALLAEALPGAAPDVSSGAPHTVEASAGVVGVDRPSEVGSSEVGSGEGGSGEGGAHSSREDGMATAVPTASVELVLRWLASFVLSVDPTPGPETTHSTAIGDLGTDRAQEIEVQARLLAAAVLSG